MNFFTEKNYFVQPKNKFSYYKNRQWGIVLVQEMLEGNIQATHQPRVCSTGVQKKGKK